MASRNFVAASTHRIATTSTAVYTQTHTQVALVTVASIPGAGVYPTIISLQSATAARELALCLNGDSSGTLSALVGATRINPSTNIIPVADGRWYFVGAAKTAGTVAVTFFMYDYLTATWTEFASSGTVASRTASAVSPNIGSRGAADYWNGRIAAVMHLPVNINLPENYRSLIGGRQSWLPAAIGVYAAFAVATRLMVDLTIGGSIRDLVNPTSDYTTGTIPVIDGASTPPGW